MKNWRFKGQDSSTQTAETARPQAKEGKKSPLVGAVEGLGPKYAWGWVDWSGAKPPEMAVTCGGESFAVFARWIARPELKASAKASNDTPGFQFGLPMGVLKKLAANPAFFDSFAVTANGAVLSFEKGVAPVMPDPLTWNQLPLEFIVPIAGVDALAEAWLYLPFRLYLRFPDGATAPESVALICNGKPLECVSLRGREKSPATGDADDEMAPILFEFELPGLIWEQHAAAGKLEFYFQAGDLTFPKIPFVLTHAHAQAWLEQLVKDGPHDSYNQMLAVEHAHFIAEELDLGETVLTYLEWTARNHGLDGYVPLPTKAEAEEAESLRKVSLKSMLLWQALREFNAQMPAWKGREEELLAMVEESLPQGSERTVFVEYLASYFFRIGRPDVIKPRIPQARLDDMANGWETFSLAMAVPLLVAHGHIEWATNVLYTLASKSGWLATDALAAASVQAAEQARVSATHEKFAYALINAIDVMAPDYWSRLHDAQLINAFCAWLDKPVFWTEWLWRDLVKAAIRNYGLSPEFWTRMEAPLATDEPLFDELRQARFRFGELRDGLIGWSSDAPMAASVRENLAYFQRAGNHEVARILRELVASKLMAVSNTDDVVPILPVQEMLAIDLAESVRLAALPVASDRELIGRMPNLRQTLAAMQGDVTHTTRYALQRRAGFMLKQLESGKAVDLAGAAIELQREVENFGDAVNQFLAVDVLARLWRIAGRTPAGSALARSIAKHAQQGLYDGADWPTQPVLSGIACLRRALSENPDRVLHTYMQQINLQLDERYRDRRKALELALEPPKKVKMSASVGQDTLVVIYSCRKYLDSRVQAIRDSWLLDIKARGIPYVILVGDGKDELEGDILGLAVSDRYEDLPAKTLAMVKWVEQHTDFQFLLKIDDDCFLNVDEYFDSLSYRKFHYYGRVIRRKLGSMDRKWHQEKSQGDRAQRAIDKSPEPAIYADGGGAYSLSRLAMSLLGVQAETDAGKRLRASSFMEDKLLGDLLAAAGINVSNEDYFTLIRRRFGANATPVAIWDNVFAPSALSPVKFAHLDTAVDMVPFRERLHSRSLWPRKIWPTYATAHLWWNKNQLELLTPIDHARVLLQEQLIVVAVMRNEELMAPHFLAHYRKLGVKTFIIVDNISDDGTREYLLRQPDVVLYSADSEYKESMFGVAWQQAVLANHCVGKWVLVADADELLVYPGCEDRPITEMLAEVDAAGYDTVCINMVDMYPFGDLEDADFEKMNPFEAAPCFDNPPLLPWRLSTGYYSNYPNRVSALRHRQMPAAEPHAFTAQKFCLMRYAPWMRFCAGLHNIANANISPDALAFAHFKYHAGFKKKVEEEVKRKQHFGDAAEYRKYLGMLAEGRGSFGQEGVSGRYVDSVSFVEAARRDSAQ